MRRDDECLTLTLTRRRVLAVAAWCLHAQGSRSQGNGEDAVRQRPGRCNVCAYCSWRSKHNGRVRCQAARHFHEHLERSGGAGEGGARNSLRGSSGCSARGSSTGGAPAASPARIIQRASRSVALGRRGGASCLALLRVARPARLQLFPRGPAH